MDLMAAIDVAASGMRAQSARVRVVSQNVANADTTAQTPEGEPYRRKLITFEQELDSATGARKVDVASIRPEQGELPVEYDPEHPAADERGYVEQPNVDPLVELMDLREATNSHRANLQVYEEARSMVSSTRSILR